MSLLGPMEKIGASRSIDENYTRGGSQSYRAYFTPTDDEVYVQEHLSLTGAGGTSIGIYSEHPSDSFALVVKITVATETGEIETYTDRTNPSNTNNGEECLCWAITLDFGPWNPLEHTDTGNPVDQPLRFKLNWTNYPKLATLDKDGNPILNTAYQPYDPPIEIDGYRGLLTVYRNEATPSLVALISNESYVNASAWNGFAARTVKVTPIALPERQYSQFTGEIYYPMEYPFEIDSNTWDKNIVNAGLAQINPTMTAPYRVTPILDDSGQPLSGPGLLDINGKFLHPPVSSSNIIINNHKIYPELDFTVFDMDSLF